MSLDRSPEWQIIRLLEEISIKLDHLIRLTEFTRKDAIQHRIQETLGSSQLRKEIYELCDGKRTVTEIAKILDQKMPNISEQLTILEESGIVSVKKRGRYKYYEKIV